MMRAKWIHFSTSWHSLFSSCLTTILSSKKWNSKPKTWKESGKLICLNLVLKLEWSVSVSSPQGPCFILYFIISDQNILSTKRCLCLSSSQNYRKNLKSQHKMYNYFTISFFSISFYRNKACEPKQQKLPNVYSTLLLSIV